MRYLLEVWKKGRLYQTWRAKNKTTARRAAAKHARKLNRVVDISYCDVEGSVWLVEVVYPDGTISKV